jgi:uncharacterized protein
MTMAYKSPGVYRERVFLQPEAQLPTGIPGFVGFATARAKLEQLPLGLNFPGALPPEASLNLINNLRYQEKYLTFNGVMSAADRTALLAISPDPAFQKAVEALFQAAQELVVLHHPQELINQFIPAPESYLGEAVSGFFANGGTRCYVVRVTPASTLEARKTALLAEVGSIDGEPTLKVLKPLEALTDLDLVAIPDVMTLVPDREAILRVQQALLRHCAQLGDRLAILDPLPDSTGESVIEQRRRLLLGSREPVNAALYYPWIRNTQQRLVPPCGHVAGIIARSDRARGVFKAPANEEIRDVLDLEFAIDNALQDQLNPENINCLRAFPGRGIRVWGARTLSRDPNWRYLNIRRLFLTVGRWIDQNMTWATLEPNSPRLWNRIQRELSTYLANLWQAGALQGATVSQAFYVKCDIETNPTELRELGQVITEIGLAPSAPAEFLIVRIIHRPGTTQVV